VAVEGATKKKAEFKKKSQSFPPWPHCPHTTIIIGKKEEDKKIKKKKER